jgi:glycosyltransferase involved in cell wall biosynthesis
MPLPASFSVVIPALNEEARLPDCLASVLAQTCRSTTEVIVVDNGSTDGTALVARNAGASVVKCPERGVVLARQAGLDAAANEVVLHLDADSRLKPGTLDLLSGVFADHAVVAVAGDVEYAPGSPGTRAMSALYRVANDVLRPVFGRPAFALAGALAFRRQALVAAGGYLIRLPHSGDEAGMLARLARQGKVIWAPDFVVESSDRRFRGRFARWLLCDLLVHTFADQLVYRFSNRSPWGGRPAIR